MTTNITNAAALLEGAATHRRSVLAGQITWGDWGFDPRRRALTHRRTGTTVDLVRVSAPHHVLREIVRVSGMPHVRRAEVGELVDALHELLGEAAEGRTGGVFEMGKVLR